MRGARSHLEDSRDAPPRRLLLEAAIRLFCRGGIGATSVDAVVAESGIARMTLYNHFGSKEGLVLAALQHEGAAWRTWFFTRLAEIGGPARARLIGVFDILEEWFVRDDYFGCAFMNAVLEARNQDGAVAAITFAHKAQVLEQLRALAAAAGAAEPDALAQQIDLVMDGAIVKALIKRSAQPALEAKIVAAALLVRHLGADARPPSAAGDA
ncbi:transcriptional regulator, TetR family [Methylocella silvestris BL2]|uniref:Transcriptional regulator, TetR family n=1 Tax=Methylocella silvestris (strain DSM 15510 / CIP 108128 / LMG 27833 / NCIMB 13906 / BL2) TaxID=395965 RepID=B8ETA8_METSB|nr:transcriptional regulator, TetR family [Methylocella silvestris BL2]